jgi:GT2 family glycosyltransferase
MHLALIVPVLNRFDLFTRLMKSVDVNVRVFVMDSYNNNLGVSGAWNEGVRQAKAAGYQYALISNDDIEFFPNTISKLYDDIVRKQACAVSPNPNSQFESQGLIPGTDFCCYMIDIPQVLNNCGTFDENFFPAYFEDNDMRYRMVLAGLNDYIDTDAPVIHHGSQTQYFDRNNPVTPPHMFENNKRYFIEKWGGEPGQEQFQTPFNDHSKTIKDWDKR